VKKGKKVKPKKVKEKEYWSCYILRSEGPEQERLTYVGMTNEIGRRLYQHNGKEKGGSKYCTAYN
jgi:predicted GIY-YIG superfamily endonuclease